MDIDSIPQLILIFLALIGLVIVFAKVLNIDILENVSSMIIMLSKNIFSSVSF